MRQLIHSYVRWRTDSGGNSFNNFSNLTLWILMMTNPNISAADEYPEPIQTQASAVSWSAILAGAAATAALSLILLMLGTGLELSSVSPWAYSGVSATTFGVSTILWVTLTQLLVSAAPCQEVLRSEPLQRLRPKLSASS